LSIRAFVAKIYSPTKVCDGAQMAMIFYIILRPVFPARRVQHISDLHSKFALRLHQCRSMVNEFVYDVVVKQLPRFQNILLIVYDHINTICAIIQ